MTAPSYFNLTCDSYKQIVFSGFSRLQEQQEFVDLTLAADGHLVKVHKNIMALASPYIKELIKSTSSDNPVIFLNNVKHTVLNYLLEYIYQGEVNLPQDCIEPFLQLSQSLYINGMAKQDMSKNIIPTDQASHNLGQSIKKKEVRKCPTVTIDGTSKDNESTSNVAARITINNDHNFEVQQFENIQISNVKGNADTNLNKDAQIANADMPLVEDLVGVESPLNIMDMDVIISQSDNPVVEKEQISTLPTIQMLSDNKTVSETGLIDLNLPINLDEEAKEALKIITQFTVTERGSVQIIVSRYIYCCHHKSRGGRKHRWRCVDYRKHHCPAYIDSFDDRIIARKGVHKHGFHDDRIYKKHEKGNIYYSYKKAKEAWSAPNDECTDIDVED